MRHMYKINKLKGGGKNELNISAKSNFEMCYCLSGKRGYVDKDEKWQLLFRLSKEFKCKVQPKFKLEYCAAHFIISQWKLW